jgi:hypothetical protein
MNHKSRTRNASGAINSTKITLPQVLSAALIYCGTSPRLLSQVQCGAPWLVKGFFVLRPHFLVCYTERLALHRCLDWLVSTMRCACTLLLIGQRHRQSGALKPTLLACIRHETCRPQLSCTASKPQHLSCWSRESAKFFPLYHIDYSSHPPPNVPHRPPVDQRTECSCYFVFTLHSLH